MQRKPRENKDKKAIVSDFHQRQDADRRRSLIKDIIFPHLLEIGDNIGYSKVFLQAFSGLMEGAYEESRKTTTIGMLQERLERKLGEVFKVSDPEQRREYDRYMSLLPKLEHVSVQDFSYAAELPRYIDGYISKSREKDPISEISIDAILG